MLCRTVSRQHPCCGSRRAPFGRFRPTTSLILPRHFSGTRHRRPPAPHRRSGSPARGGRPRRRPADVHAAGVALHRGVEELLDLGEGDDLVELLRDLRAASCRGSRRSGRCSRGRSARGGSRCRPRAGCRRGRAARPAPVVGSVIRRQDLQQRALAGPVAADDADHLARLDLEGDVLQRPEVLGIVPELRCRGSAGRRGAAASAVAHGPVAGAGAAGPRLRADSACPVLERGYGLHWLGSLSLDVRQVVVISTEYRQHGQNLRSVEPIAKPSEAARRWHRPGGDPERLEESEHRTERREVPAVPTRTVPSGSRR